MANTIICNFEENRGLLYEIRDLSVGCRYYATNSMEATHDAAYFIAMFSILERNASSILKLFDEIEKLPQIEK